MSQSFESARDPIATDERPHFGQWSDYSVLIVDDEPGMRSFLERALCRRCGRVASADGAASGLGMLEREHFDLIILDITLPGKSGIEWLHELRNGGFRQRVILITAFADIESAIGALRAGAFDFIPKPFRIDQILNSVERCFDHSRLERENFVLRREVRGGKADTAVQDLPVGESLAMQEIRALVERLAPVPSTVLITGESGTGKEVVARALHELSPRANRPFVPINCGAIAPEIIESELFGHVRGAFTGASTAREGLFFYAQGGTLFLDEVAELPLPLQSKLLRVLEEKRIRPVGAEREVPVDVRVIAATNRELGNLAETGEFRQDLYYRLDVMHIHIPPLRARPQDIEPLARHFMAQLAGQLDAPPVPFDRAMLSAMQAYPWPGNARELRNVIERSLILRQFPMSCFLASKGGDTAPPQAAQQEPQEDSLAAVEKRHILQVLSASGGNKAEAARRLRVSRKTLDRKCAEWGV